MTAASQLQTGAARQRRARHDLDGDPGHRARQRLARCGDADNASLLIGQDFGLIHDIRAAGEIVERIVAEAEALLKDHLPKLVRAG